MSQGGKEGMREKYSSRSRLLPWGVCHGEGLGTTGGGGEGSGGVGGGEMSLEQGRAGLRKKLLRLFSKSSLTLECCRRYCGKDIIITICIPLEI